MPIRTAMTGNMTRARRYADVVLDTKRTAHLDVLVENYGSLQACKTVAVSIQRSFCSMRAVDRQRKAAKANKLSAVDAQLMTESVYDEIICGTQALPNSNGYRVTFEYAGRISDKLVVTFEGEGGLPDAVNKDVVDLWDQVEKDVTKVPLDQLFALAESQGYTGKEIINNFVAPLAYKHKGWIKDVAVPAWRERYETPADAPAPATDDTTPAPKPKLERPSNW